MLLMAGIFFYRPATAPLQAQKPGDRTEELALPKEFCLENGLKVYLLPYSWPRLTTVVLGIKVGAADETPDTSGHLHLLEHCLLFRQSHLMEKQRLYRTIKEFGLYYNAHTEQDLMLFEICLPAEYLLSGLHLLKQVAFSFNITEEGLEKEKKVILKELQDIQRDPLRVGLAKAYELVFPNTGYALPVYGQPEVIRKANLSQLQTWHQKYFNPNNSALVVIGNFSPEDLEEDLKQMFSDLKAGATKVNRIALNRQSLNSGQLVELRMKVADTYLVAALAGPEYNHPDRIGLDLLSEMLGYGLYPLLYSAFASQTDLVSSINLHYLTHDRAGLIFIILTTRVDKVQTVRRLLQNFFSQLATFNYSREDYFPQEGLILDFLQGGKSRLRWTSEKMMENPLLLARALAKHLLLATERQKTDYLQTLDSLNSSDMRKIARKYLSRGQVAWVVIKP